MDDREIKERIGRLIQQVSRNWRRSVNQTLAPLGLTEATWLPLLFLRRAGPVRQIELADYLALDRSSVVRLLDTLAAQGLVERQDDPDDRRAKRVVLTEAAEPLVRAAQEAANAVRAEALAGLSPQELATAEAVLARILQQLPSHPCPAEVPGS